MSEWFRITGEGEAMVAEMSFGHNPRAYLCSERGDDDPFDSDELCGVCSDGFEAIHWKRRAIKAEARVAELEARQ